MFNFLKDNNKYYTNMHAGDLNSPLKKAGTVLIGNTLVQPRNKKNPYQILLLRRNNERS